MFVSSPASGRADPGRLRTCIVVPSPLSTLVVPLPMLQFNALNPTVTPVFAFQYFEHDLSGGSFAGTIMSLVSVFLLFCSVLTKILYKMQPKMQMLVGIAYCQFWQPQRRAAANRSWCLRAYERYQGSMSLRRTVLSASRSCRTHATDLLL